MAKIYPNLRNISLPDSSKDIEKWRKAIELTKLNSQLDIAITNENYHLAHELKCKIEELKK